MLELTTAQRNQIYKIIEQNGFDPKKTFSWGKTQSKFNSVHSQYGENPDKAEALFVSAGGKTYSFTFEQSNFHKFAASVRPALDGENYVGSDLWLSFLTYFAQWLSVIRTEIEEPDLWTTAFANVAVTGPESYSDKTAFSESESRQIKGVLKDIQRRLEALPNFDSERVAKLEQAFGYLEEKLDNHVSKFDFKNIFVGILLHIYIAPWLSPFADQFRDAVMLCVGPHLKSLFQGLALH